MKSFKEASSQYGKRNGGGALVTKAEYAGSVFKPKWSSKGEPRAETHVRFVGPLADDRKNFLPCRYGPEESEFGSWLACYPVFAGGTIEQFSFIAGYVNPDCPDEVLDLDLNPTPATDFHAHARKMAYADPNLKSILLDGGKGRRAALPRSIEGYGFAQAVILQHGAQNYYKRPQGPALFMMGSGATGALMTLLNQKTEGYAGDPLDLRARFAAGDILDASTGSIISFYNALSGGAAAAETEVSWDKAGAMPKPTTTQEFAHYEAAIKSKMSIPRDASGQIINLGGKPLFTPWTKVMRFLGEKEQVEILCRAYADLPGLLRDCLRKYSSSLPNFVLGNASVTVQGNRQAAYQAPQTLAAPQQVQVAAPVDEPDVAWGNAGQPSEGDNGAELKAAMDMGLVGPGAPAAQAAQATVAPSATADSRVTAAKARLAALQQSVK